MSTATIDQTTNDSLLSQVPIIEEKKTYARVVFTKNLKQEDGSVKPDYTVKVMSEKDADETVEDFRKAVEAHAADPTKKAPDWDDVQVEVKQTFGFDHANTPEAAVEVFGGNTTEMLKQLNNAIDVKLGNRVRSIMLATEDDGSFAFYPKDEEPVVSLRKYIGEESAARGKTDFQKTVALAGKLSPEQKAALLALLSSQ